MRIGINLPQSGVLADPAAIVEVSRAVEEMGYHSLWVGDRLLLPVHPRDRYPDGLGPALPEHLNAHLDPLTALSFAAACTTRMRLGTGVLNGPWYPPALLARALTTVDVLSGGRLDVGLGLGWMRDEYEAVGAPWADRGDRLDETIDLLERIWADDVVAYDGKRFAIPESRILPKPVQAPRPPLLLAGFTDWALGRIARRADGWLAAGGLPLPLLTVMSQAIRSGAEAYGRDPAGLRMVLRLNPMLTPQPTDPELVPAFGTLAQLADHALASPADEVLLDLSQTVTSAAEMIDRAGDFLAAIWAG